jgi:hypothetical protein
MLFNENATLRKLITSQDSEVARPAVQGHDFTCWRVNMGRRSRAITVENAFTENISLILQTQDAYVGANAESGDEVTYNGKKYRINDIVEIRSSAFLGAVEYAIGLQ